ncbi:MAG TPA: FAD-dependent oxidoreductase [Streptosporangiaceae bacterium]
MGEPAQARPVVAVLGGGYAGVNVAKSLDDVAEVLLIEPKEAFVHNVASLRALVAPSWLPRVYLPYAGLLSHGRVIRDRAAKVDAGRVELASGQAIQADYVVLATGSAYPFPAKSDVDSTAAAHDKVLAAHAALAAAGRVLLLGAGPVGIELAGEISAIWPDKHITMVDPAGDILGARFRPELKAEIRRQLAALGIQVLLGARLAMDPPGEPGELGTFTVRTESGAELTADIWFRCYGVRPVSDYLAGSLAGARQPDGRVAVAPSLQVVGQGRVFALGDVATADHPMAGAAGRQAAIVAGNIRAFITGQGALAEYEPPPPGIIVPIGPAGGAGQRGGQDELLPAEVVAELKGRDMMVDRYIELLGVPVSGTSVSADGTPG